jgi:hypothetical protein
VRRTPELEAQTLDLRVLSTAESSHVALAAPAPEAAAIADGADIELAGAADSGGADVASGPAVGSAITPASGTPLSWSELDEWLDAS